MRERQDGEGDEYEMDDVVEGKRGRHDRGEEKLMKMREIKVVRERKRGREDDEDERDEVVMEGKSVRQDRGEKGMKMKVT